MTTCWSSEQYFLVVSVRSKMEVWIDCLKTEHTVEDTNMKDDKSIPSRAWILTRKEKSSHGRERLINEWTRMSERILTFLEDNAFSKYSSRDDPLIPYSVIRQSRYQYLYNLRQQTIISAESTVFFHDLNTVTTLIISSLLRVIDTYPELIIDLPNWL